MKFVSVALRCNPHEDWILRNIAEDIKSRSRYQVKIIGEREVSDCEVTMAMHQGFFKPGDDIAIIHHFDETHRANINKCVQLAKYIVVTNPIVAKYVSARRKDGITMITGGVDAGLFRPTNEQRGKRTTTIGTVSANYPRKRLDWVRWCVDHSNVKWLCYLKQRSQHYNEKATKGVRTEIVRTFSPHFYHEIDYYVCTSVVEGGPQPLLEAAASGVPCVSTNVGIASLLLEPSQMFLRKEDIITTIQSLDGGVADRQLKRIKKRFTVEQMVLNYDGLFLAASEGKRK